MLLLKRRGYWLYGEDKALIFQTLSKFHTAKETLCCLRPQERCWRLAFTGAWQSNLCLYRFGNDCPLKEATESITWQGRWLRSYLICWACSHLPSLLGCSRCCFWLRWLLQMPKNFVHRLVTPALTCDLIQILKVEQSQTQRAVLSSFCARVWAVSWGWRALIDFCSDHRVTSFRDLVHAQEDDDEEEEGQRWVFS